MFRKTLDIDLTSKWSRFKPKDKEFMLKMIYKITNCPFCSHLKINQSSFKGYHITLFCKKDCDICRLCYDDTRRLAYDLSRPKYARNILFEKKERIIIK